jgi:hypothetical protein
MVNFCVGNLKVGGKTVETVIVPANKVHDTPCYALHLCVGFGEVPDGGDCVLYADPMGYLVLFPLQ